MTELIENFLYFAKKYAPEHRIKELFKKYHGLELANQLSILYEEYENKNCVDKKEEVSYEEAYKTVMQAAEAYKQEMELTI